MGSVQGDPQRTARLLKVFRDVTKGGRSITTAANARLFLEAVRTNPSPVQCLETVTASTAAKDALRYSLRLDLSASSIRSHVLPFIEYLSDPSVKMVYNGELLHQILLLISQPPTLWNSLMTLYRESRLDENDLFVFAWLCLELASVPGKEHDDLVHDISSAVDQKPFQQAQDQRTRELMYRTKKVLALRSSPSPDRDVDGAGGRHDNDFADFRDVSIFPTSDEFHSSAPPFYRRAAEVTAIDPSDRPRAYLDNQFRLLREDMLGELREDLTVAIGKKKGRRGMPQILAGLTPVGIDTGDDKRGRFCAVLLSCQVGLEVLSKMDGPQRARFLKDHKGFLRHQSFGALCSNSKIIAFASLIRDNDRLVEMPPVITLQFTNSDALARALLALQSPADLRFVLVDTPIFAYQPVLERLQEITEMPLERELLFLNNNSADALPTTLDQSVHIKNYVSQFKQILEGASSTFSMGSQQFQLDKSQIRSVLSALQSPLALVQGPPGTGKSFVGALAAKILLKDPNKRILVLSYTNHALDQFLEDLMNIGISPDTMVRLGSKFTDKTESLLLERQIRNRAGWGRLPWDKISNAKQNMSNARAEIDKACGSLVRGKISFLEILNYLEFEEDAEDFYDAFTLPEQDDGFQLAGNSRQPQKAMSPDYLLDRWARGLNPGELTPLISPESRRIWQIPEDQRRKHMTTWIESLRGEQIETIQHLVRQFNDAQREVDTLYNESKCNFVQKKRLVGCTTTAAAMYKSLIKAARPDVVLVEEAGEILEAHVLTALHSSTSQVILIGDHKQLRPKINNYALSVEKGEGFDLNRSLFERLILQEHEHTTLQKQHRMHPDISDLVRQMTYPLLQDDEKTLLRPEAKGLQGRVCFINHSHPEDLAGGINDRHGGEVSASKRNRFEAHMVLKLVKYLGQQGYKTSNIVVLTPYIGQVSLLKEMLSKEVDPVLNDLDSFELIRAGLMTAAAAKVKDGSGQIKLSTIDNYQGEESDIVIASMTRSNTHGDIGFMKAPERLNVLCSRARECLIMIGNMETFMASAQGKPVWLPFFEILKEKGYLYDGVPVRCQQHPEKTALLKDPSDFDAKCADGGCDESCNALLSCGKHRCQLRCHRIKDHAKVACHERIKKTCDRGHNYTISCSAKEDACSVCVKEDEDNRRRIRRNLEMEKERLLAQQRYAKELQVIQDELDHERRKLQYAQEDDDQKKKLKQALADLKDLRDTRSRAEAMKAAQKAAPKAPDAAANGGPPPPQAAIAPGSAQEEWEAMKSQFGARSDPLDTLMGMIGLESVKQEFLSIKSKVDVSVRQQISLSKERFGCTLLGNPGTGKTTIARIYGKFLTSVGVIAGSCFKETSGSKLANMGVTGCEKLLEDVLNAGGGVVFIDEAYQLSSGNSPGGKAVLDYLLAEVENLTGKVVFVLAGYIKQMESFFAHNPGFPSRFPLEMKFEDYEDAELLQILTLQINKKYGGRMKWQDDLYLRVATRRLGLGRGKEGFGNARAVENLLAKIMSRQANRLRKERRKGVHSDDLLFTMEDLVGPEPSNALTTSKAWAKLQGLIGLKSVKQSVKALVDSLQTNYRRELAEEPILEYTLNKVFLGSPGTGKTTIAKLYGEILVDIGMLSNSEVIVKNPSDFVGAVIGGSEVQTKGILASTVGKVLVIDEAYGLFTISGGRPCPFRTAVVDTIVAEVQSVPGEDRCVLLLGYKDQMEKMFQNVNPGLSRRFPMDSAFTFEDFTSDELRKILDMKIKQQGFKATDQAKRVAMETLERARNRPNFGNAGEVDILLNDAKARHQTRLSANETGQVSTLEALDFDENFERAERQHTNVAKLFEGTIGCEMIVAKLEGYQEDVRSMKALGMNPKESMPFNFVFRGPPGTGKTSTARKMGKVFYDMGFLASAEVLDCSATDLIGSYVGHTGPKVQTLLDKALGKVLFVDEAYRLNQRGHNNFAKEAVDEIVDCVTKERYKGRMVIILAGYDDEINELLSINPGMSSRFPESIDFHPLTPENCFDLLANLLQKQKQKTESRKPMNSVLLACLEQPTLTFKKEIIENFGRLTTQASWANARDVESLAKSVFSYALKARQGTCVTITETIILDEMGKMFKEREGRNKQAKRTKGGRQSSPPIAPAMPPPQAPPAPASTGTATQQQPQQLPDRTKDKDTQAENTATASGSNGAGGVQRDAGVSDEVWEQLERDKKAQEQKEGKYRSMLKAQKAASGAARDAILKQILEEEERRKKEEEQRKKAARLGKCPAGYAWVKQAQGFRCAGGSHFISDEQIARV
ncbi:nfx1-type zinc finger-containing protein 1 [Colletotrichum kahawae]|uniref:Nfx1-type zinc finger-containing protein 1 n=1 Tax=Colletotrichum kahawae TaxID=34407 RepID=A0AAD9Y633_COLKA|nr:nfx1-type zinc finger-containing protein 1 [Colletotrichum kahawae]